MKFSKFHAELTEAKKFKKGDSVKIKDVKKYDALAKDDEGTVIGMMGSKVMVKVGTGQMNVDPKDLILESDELTEGKKLRNVLSDKEMEKSMKKALADKANYKGGKVNWNFIDADMYMELTAKGYDLRHPSVDYMNRFDKLADKLDPEMNECVRLAEASKYTIEVAVRDARKANEILQDMFRNDYKTKGSNVFVFKDEETAYDAGMTLMAQEVEVTKENVGLDESVNESRKDAPKGDRNTTADNPLIVVYDDEFTKGKPGMSGMMNLQTWMSIHGISKKFQKELADMVLKAGAGKQTEVSKKILKDTHDEYKEEGLRPKRYWIELSKHHAKEVK
jgi:hypothetical protein